LWRHQGIGCRCGQQQGAQKLLLGRCITRDTGIRRQLGVLYSARFRQPICTRQALPDSGRYWRITHIQQFEPQSACAQRAHRDQCDFLAQGVATLFLLLDTADQIVIGGGGMHPQVVADIPQLRLLRKPLSRATDRVARQPDSVRLRALVKCTNDLETTLRLEAFGAHHRQQPVADFLQSLERVAHAQFRENRGSLAWIGQWMVIFRTQPRHAQAVEQLLHRAPRRRHEGFNSFC